MVEPPPILQERAEESLPKMHCVPVHARYLDLQTYFSVFHPLMLHEMWATLTNDYKQQPDRKMDVLVQSYVLEDSFALLQCSLVADDVDNTPQQKELVNFNFVRPDSGKEIPVFGLVESSTTGPADCESSIDQRLTVNLNAKPKVATQATIRIHGGYIPKKNAVYSLTRVASIATTMTQLEVQTSSTNFIMMHKIINPQLSTFLLDRQIDTVATNLNPLQSQVMFSISNAMLTTSVTEPKIFLIQGPSGLIAPFIFAIEH